MRFESDGQNMSKADFVRRACADTGVPCVQIIIPPDANLNQFCAALIAAMETEFGKED